MYQTGCNADARRCPTCNAKASLKDIRLLFAKKLVAIDTTELTALEVRLEKVRKFYFKCLLMFSKNFRKMYL